MSRDKLAIDGGVPIRDQPLPPMYPGGMAIGEEEKQAVLAVLEDKSLFRYRSISGSPSRVAAFEQKFAEHMGARFGLAVSSGTAALHTGLVALGIGPGDEVIIPAYTFIASAGAVIAARAVPIIAEVDDSLTLDPDDLERHLTPRTRAIMPVHMRGAPCDMDRVIAFARRNGLRVIEDVAQADGASYHGQRLGTFGDVGAFSLQYHKVITTGEGGAVLTDDPVLYERANIFHDGAGGFFGSRRQPVPVSFFPGLNYRMSEIAGALALVQLNRLEWLLRTMRSRKARIRAAIEPTMREKGLHFRRLHDPEGEAAVALILLMPTAGQAREMARALTAENIGAGSLFSEAIPDWHVAFHWKHILTRATPTADGCPFRCPLYDGDPRYSEDMAPRTLDLLGRSVHVNVSPLLTETDADQIGEGIVKVLNALRWQPF
ncbi:MAG: DegT/DnrJ/EryC1/StrS family aminotransferase [Chloroflexi bacterium]|nr:DegT/DnrJ/EryC1/StrS family aminotransferase [Chloroflexota bacterium]